MISSITEGLNEPQHLAVTAKSCNMLVLAGAGSGKTRVLVSRIAWLMREENYSPYSILAVTFTNKAAGEMRSRIEKLVGISTKSLWVGTFHSLAHRLLRLHWQDAKLAQNFQILDSDDQYRLIRRTIKMLNLDENQWSPKQSQSFINNMKDAGKRPGQVDKPRDAYHLTLLRIYQAYEEACERGSLVDFAELLLRSYELLLQNPLLLQHYHQRFQQILIDEFQDTNAIQYAWIKLLAHEKNHVMCVGDDDQSIYGWRGAEIENIQHFSRDFPNTQIIRLEQNYRSTSIILQATNVLISNNEDRLGKNLWTEQEGGELISVYAAFNEIEEARFIVSRIQEWKRKINFYNDIAILYRSNAQSRILEEALIAANIPYRIYGGLRFFERAEIKDALAYLRLIANRHDDAAFERVINTPTRGIGDKTLDVLREQAKQYNISLWQASLQVSEELTARANNALQAFIQLIDELDKNTELLELDARTEKILYGSGLMESYERSKNENTRMRVENLNELISATKQFALESNASQPILISFLSHVALDSSDTQEDAPQDCVQLMTLHSAKGLEFPLVFMSGLEEGLFPHAMSFEESDRLSEERRLCYVGMTRAMKKLYLTYAEVRRLHGKEAYHRPSRFLRELPDHVLDKVRFTHHFSRPSTSNTEIAGFKLGQRVKHAKFGEGIIVDLEGSGTHARAQVRFSEGTKWLVVGYAGLELI